MPAARDRMALEPGGIWLAPAGARVTISGGRLRVRAAPEPAGERGTIDSFFVSLAEDQKDRAVGIIMEGVTHGDGTLGTTAIKELGGFTLAERSGAQDAEELHDQSPRTAAAIADFLGPVEEVAGRVLAHHLKRRRQQAAHSFEDMVAEAGPQLKKIATVLRNRTGHDFHGYKHNTFFRRVQRRMQVTQAETVEAYLDVLRTDAEEAQNLFNDLLIGVTHFFRDQKEFQALEREVIPRLFEGKGAGDQIRVWVLGCATGEEAYSLAILLREHMSRIDAVPHIQIFATDIDSRALTQARVGRYAASAVQELSPERLARWFVKEGNTYCIVKELREMCIFSQHNLIKDAPFSRLDLVSCRNLLIYLNAELQNRVIPLFHFALKPGGFLFLGNSENVSRHGKLFAPVDRRFRIFRQVETINRVLPQFPLSAATGVRPPMDAPVLPRPAFTNGSAVAKQAERLMERYAPAYLILDENHDVLHFSGRTGRYLDPPTGIATLNVFNLIHRDLRMDLRAALLRIETDGQPVRVNGLRVGQNGKTMFVTLTIEPLDGGPGHPRRHAVILQDGHVVSDEDEAHQFASARLSSAEDETVRRLEEELRITRERLQATIEELESTNEELKASNEEYQSVNEELQSSNEELETSKEELQSLNEELQTVNGELAHRVEELGRANSDLKNLLESTQIATVFLDNELRIKSFTPAITDIVHLIDSDVGRPIHHIAKKIAYDDLEGDARRVIRTLSTIERETASPQSGSRFLTRILPYRSVDNVIEGVVITFLDITPLSRAEQRLRESESRFRSVVEGIPQLVWRAVDGGQWTWSSPQWTQFTGQTEEASLGQGWLEAVHPDDRDTVREAWATAAETGKLEVDHRLWNADAGDWRSFRLRASPVRNDAGQPVEWFGTATDVDELLALQQRQEMLLHELQHRVRNILALVRSIATRTARTSETVEDYERELGGRITAMARTQNILTSAPGARLDLAELFTNELIAQGARIPGNVSVAGPHVTLSGKAAESLSLAIHELATNAAKYGALSSDQGRLTVSWQVADPETSPRLVISWVEEGVEVPPPKRRGFGSDLIEKVVPYEFNGTGRLDLGSEGLRCNIELPLSEDMQLDRSDRTDGDPPR
nr:CheR family methyltransferase [Rhodobacter sp. SGA-6-6]